MAVVSVALPVFNGARFLSDAIASILHQSFSDLELIISDDGSTDRSLDIARDFAARDRRVVLVTSPHRGIASAMNGAVRVARGEYLAPMDQDDVALPDRLQRLVTFLQNNPGIALVGGSVRRIDEKRKRRPDKAPAAFSGRCRSRDVDLDRCDSSRELDAHERASRRGRVSDGFAVRPGLRSLASSHGAVSDRKHS